MYLVRAEDLPQIRSLPLFEAMGDSSFDSLMQAAYLQAFPAQLELVREGDPADFMYVVLQGTVELFAGTNGRETSMEIVRPLGAFIVAAVLKDAVYLMSARTLERSRLLLIPSENVRDAFQEDGGFARSMVLELARCYRNVVKEQKNLKLRTAVERLGNRLLRLEVEQGGTGTLELPYDKRKLAAVLGMTPENLSRAFNTLKPYGVEVDGSTIRLTNRDALEQLAKPNRLIDDQDR